MNHTNYTILAILVVGLFFMFLMWLKPKVIKGHEIVDGLSWIFLMLFGSLLIYLLLT